MRIQKPVMLAFIMTLLGVAATAMAGARLVPTSINLRKPLTLVAVAKVTEQVAPNRFRFAKVKMLVGEAPEEPWDIRMSAETAAKVEIGATYTIGFSGHILHGPRKYINPWIDPEGLRLVDDPFVQGEVLLPVNDDLTLLLGSSQEVYSKQPKQMISTIMKMIYQEDEVLSRIAVSELALRKQLVLKTDTRTRSMLRNFITLEDSDPEMRQLVLEAGYFLPQGPESAWALAAARHIVHTARLDVDLDSFEPGLQRAAANMLMQRGDRSDSDDLIRLLASHSSGVAMAALGALDKVYSTAAYRAVVKVLERKDLPVQSRTDFEQYLRRKQLAPSARPQPLLTPTAVPQAPASGGEDA